jgi:hypothetical protein
VFVIADMFISVSPMELYSKALKSMSSPVVLVVVGLLHKHHVIVKAVNTTTKGFAASGEWLADDNINRNHLDLFWFWLLAQASVEPVPSIFILGKLIQVQASSGLQEKMLSSQHRSSSSNNKCDPDHLCGYLI